MDKLISNSRIISIYELISMVNNYGSLSLNFELIKRKNQNTIKERSVLIENILLGLPLQTIVIEQSRYYRPTIVSGNSMVETILDFSNNKFQLTNLNHMKSLNNAFFKDFNFAQERSFYESNVIITEYFGDIDPLIKCRMYRNANRYNNDSSINLNQKVREICFPIGSKILEDLSGIIFNKLEIHNRYPFKGYDKSRRNSVMLSILLLFLFYEKKINDIIFNKIYSDENENLAIIKDKLLQYLDFNKYNELSFIDIESVQRFVDNNHLYFFVEKLIGNIYNNFAMHNINLLSNESLEFKNWISLLYKIIKGR